MSAAPILSPPWSWCSTRAGESDSEHMILWHGCTGDDAASIVQSGVDPTVGQPDTDFGQGFYLTTLQRQARQWAWLRYYSLPPAKQGGGNTPMTLRFRVARIDFARLESLHFVLGDYENEDLWSLIQHCRQSVRADPANNIPAVVNNHKCNLYIGPDRRGWYDVVNGPVADKWKQRVAMLGSDQKSFHTAQAAQILNHLIASNDRDKFRLVPV